MNIMNYVSSEVASSENGGEPGLEQEGPAEAIVEQPRQLPMAQASDGESSRMEWQPPQQGPEMDFRGTMGYPSGLRVDTKRYSSTPKMPNTHRLFTVDGDSRNHLHEFSAWIADRGFHDSQRLALLRLSLDPAVRVIILQQMSDPNSYEEMVYVLKTSYGSGGVPIKEQQDATAVAQELTCRAGESSQAYVTRVCKKLAYFQKDLFRFGFGLRDFLFSRFILSR
jgi:hypothetical protein